MPAEPSRITGAASEASEGFGLGVGAVLPFPADRRRIVELMALASRLSHGAPRRRPVARTTHRFDLPGLLVAADVEQPGGSTVCRQVCSINVSSGGACLLAPGYLHRRTRITARFNVANGGGLLRACGTVRWCEFVSAPFHLVGVAWDEPLEVKGLVEPEAWAAASDVLAASVTIEGEALVFSEHAMDRALLTMLLSETAMAATEASETGEALDLIKQCDYDVVLLDVDMSAMSAEELFDLLAQLGYDGPLVAMSRDASSSSLTYADASQRMRFLAKPIDESSLHGALRGLLHDFGLRSAGSGPIESSLCDRAEFAAYISSFVSSLVEASSSLLALTEAGHRGEVIEVVKQIAANSAGFGFADLGERAEKLVGRLEECAGVEECKPALRAFCALLLRLRRPGGGEASSGAA